MALVTNEDLPWILENLRAARGDKEIQAWAEAVWNAFNQDRDRYTDEILAACYQVPTLAMQFSYWLKPVELGSEVERKSREEYLELKKLSEPKMPRALPGSDPADEVRKVLDAFETGPLDPFWHLDRKLAIAPSEQYYRLSVDWETSPGWKAASPETKSRILSAAKRFILEYRPNATPYLGKNTTNVPSHSGSAAFKLLLKFDPDFIGALDATVWDKWSHALVAYLEPRTDEKTGEDEELIRMAYRTAPGPTLEALMILLEADNERLGHLFNSYKADACWDKRIADAFLKRAKKAGLKIEVWDGLMNLLIGHDHEEAREYLRGLLVEPNPIDGLPKQQSTIAFRLLFEKGKNSDWVLIWKTMETNRDLAREGFLSHAFRMRSDTWNKGGSLPEIELARLFLWLCVEFPYSEDSKQDSGVVTPRDHVGNFRDSVLRMIENAGTPESCQAIRWISGQLPHLLWMKWVLRTAEEITRRRTWKPPVTAEILELMQRGDSFRVCNEEQLATLVLRILRDLDASLQGVTPAAIELWNEDKRKRFWPKDEQDLSDWIVRRLDRELKGRGMVLHREVEIRRGQGAKGERTDILVTTFIPGADRKPIDIITVVVEVKGCWNRDLMMALETQLNDRYLKDNATRTGIYIVGWFACDQWDESDDRKHNTPKVSLEALREQLVSQAQELSGEDRRLFSFVLNAGLRP